MTKFSSGDLAHRARKRFGQNFLVDHAVLDRIARAVHPAPGQHLVEIGPGKGALTELLVQEAERRSVIELDRDLVPRSEERRVGTECRSWRAASWCMT